MKKQIAYIIKHNEVVQFFYIHIMSFVFRFIGLFVKVDEHLVLLTSYGGDQYSDSPKTLFEAMKKDERFKEYRYVWAFGNPDAFTIPGAKKIKIDSFSYFLTALKAKLWITNVNMERGLHFKKKNQIYLNTWHGTGPKKCGNAINGRNDYDFSYVDIICVDGKFYRDIMINWFKAKDENLLYCGRPREDELFTFNEETTKRVHAKLGIPDNKKVLLYMPTWREYKNLALDTDLWEKELADEYVMLVRAHHFAQNDISITDKPFWIDVTNYPDVNDLYWIADILISDYSSAFFDFGLLKKPIVCFAYDYEQYIEETGLFTDMKADFPGGIKKTELEVIQCIKNMDYEKASAEAKAYIDCYVQPRKGSATEACLSKIWEKING